MLINEEQSIKILPLTIDGIFKMYFGDSDNLPQLRSFLMAHVEIDEGDLTEIQILNSDLTKTSIHDKGFQVDLLLKTKSGNDIHIEMQTGKETYFKERSQLYNARTTSKQLKVGQKYDKTKRTISIIIIDFDLFGDYNRYHERLFMRRDNNEIFTKAQEINIINLQRVEESKCKKQYLWGKLLKVETMEELEMIANESEEMKVATEKLLEVSADEIAQVYALSEWNHQQKIHNRKLYEQQQQERNLKEGREKGLKEGREEEKLGITKKLLEKGISVEVIAEVTGLSIEKINLQKI